MSCLRCGRETEEGRAFCDRCLEEMEKYPVRPGTAVMLPHRPENAPPKKVKRHVPVPAEERIRSLKKQRAILWAALCLTVLLLVSFLILERAEPGKDYLRPGQNYSAIETNEDTSTP